MTTKTVKRIVQNSYLSILVPHIFLNKLPNREFFTFIFVYNLQLLICIFMLQQTTDVE